MVPNNKINYSVLHKRDRAKRYVSEMLSCWFGTELTFDSTWRILMSMQCYASIREVKNFQKALFSLGGVWMSKRYDLMGGIRNMESSNRITDRQKTQSLTLYRLARNR